MNYPGRLDNGQASVADETDGLSASSRPFMNRFQNDISLATEDQQAPAGTEELCVPPRSRLTQAWRPSQGHGPLRQTGPPRILFDPSVIAAVC